MGGGGVSLKQEQISINIEYEKYSRFLFELSLFFWPRWQILFLF